MKKNTIEAKIFKLAFEHQVDPIPLQTRYENITLNEEYVHEMYTRFDDFKQIKSIPPMIMATEVIIDKHGNMHKIHWPGINKDPLINIIFNHNIEQLPYKKIVRFFPHFLLNPDSDAVKHSEIGQLIEFNSQANFGEVPMTMRNIKYDEREFYEDEIKKELEQMKK